MASSPVLEVASPENRRRGTAGGYGTVGVWWTRPGPAGGSFGSLSAANLNTYPSLRGVQQEHPESDSTKPPHEAPGDSRAAARHSNAWLSSRKHREAKIRGIYMILATFCSRTMKRSRLSKGGAGLPPTPHTPRHRFLFSFLQKHNDGSQITQR